MISPGEEAIATTQQRWVLLGEIVTGADHQRRGAPCQDAGKRWTDDLIVVAAVADGHGSDRHPRSEIGARVAVDVVVEELRQLAESPSSDLSSLRNDHRLTRRLVWKWREHVLADARARPEPVSADAHEAIRLYGTTLLALLVTKTYWLALQIGDGAIVRVAADGSAARVFDPDEDSFGNATHSLCSRDPVPHMRVQVGRIDAHVPNAPVLFLLCTDGLEGAFVEETRLLDLARYYLDRLRHVGQKTVEEGLQQELNGVSERSIGDDIALALVWRPEESTGIAAIESESAPATDGEPDEAAETSGFDSPSSAVLVPESAESTDDQPSGAVMDSRTETFDCSPQSVSGQRVDSPNPEQPHAPPTAE